jgi:ribonuclease BN (tRNA processing enzyme)
MMKLLFLGSGSAFTVGGDNFHSNMLLINEQDDKLLIDCGSDIRFSLYEAGFSYADITDIYISHLHSDHVGGLEYIGLSTRFDPRCHKPSLYISKELASELWERTLSGGMRSIEGDIADLNTYFEVHPIKFNECFSWEKIDFELVKVVHIDNGYYLMPVYGLFFEIEGTKIFLTSDTQLCLDKFSQYYEQADIIFQDCEISKFPTPVHARYEKLLTLPEKIKNKMWLYGYQPAPLPNAPKDGFCGFVKRGQMFEFSLTPNKAAVLISEPG